MLYVLQTKRKWFFQLRL